MTQSLTSHKEIKTYVHTKFLHKYSCYLYSQYSKSEDTQNINPTPEWAVMQNVIFSYNGY